MAKQLPANITSYDLFKALALVLMLADHIGYYFYDDVDWWRVAGRICVPIWFFLIGYANSRDLGPRMWIGAVVLVLFSMLTGEWLLPVNILFTMIIVRLVLDRVMRACKTGEESFMAISTVLLFLALPTYNYWEYGTQGIIMAMFGYLMRNKPDIGEVRDQVILRKLFILFAMSQYIFIQGLMFAFPLPEMVVFSLGTFVVMAALYDFQPKEYPALTAKLPHFAVAILEFMGRRTLEIYVAHLILFKLLGPIVDPERFQWLQWSWQMQ